MDIIENLNWRYAVKKFDATKKVSDEHIEQLKKVIQLSASSYGLQLYKVLIVEDRAMREKLRPASWGQSQISDASHLLVFCNYTEVNEEHIDSFVKIKAEVRNKPYEALKGYGDYIKKSILPLPDIKKNEWTAKQTYLALGNLLSACAEMKIDACPMEGFDPAEYNNILGLDEKGLNAAVVVTIGYRAEDDQEQFQAKVRRPMDALFETV